MRMTNNHIQALGREAHLKNSQQSPHHLATSGGHKLCLLCIRGDVWGQPGLLLLWERSVMHKQQSCNTLAIGN